MRSISERWLVKPVGEVAEEPGIRECLQWFTRQKRWIHERHLQVCRIPAPTFFEGGRARWVADQLRELGCQVRQDGAGNVIARPAGAPGEPLVALSAHLDTVIAPRTADEIRAEPDGGLRGPGVSDNGAGLAALLAVAGALKDAPLIAGLECGLALLANVCEEGEGNLNGMRYFCEETEEGSRARAFVVLDGAALDHITCSALESRRFEVVFSGPGGHSWSDFGTASPVHALARAVTLFLEADPIKQAAGAFNFGVIEGGASVNAIPAEARVKVDLRSESADGVEGLASLLAGCVARAADSENAFASRGKVAAKTRLIGARPGGRLPADSPVVGLLEAVDRHLGIRSQRDCASTDANIPLSKGLPAVSIGAGGRGGGAHSPGEWYHPLGRDLGLKRIFLHLVLLLRQTALARGEM